MRDTARHEERKSEARSVLSWKPNLLRRFQPVFVLISQINSYLDRLQAMEKELETLKARAAEKEDVSKARGEARRLYVSPCRTSGLGRLR